VLSSQAELDSMYRLLPLVGCTNTSIIWSPRSHLKFCIRA
jgi:hypothetical protein